MLTLKVINEGYIAEFDDISNKNVILKMECGILESNGNYSEDEAKITFK